MGSGTGFQSTTEEGKQKHRKKKAISSGLLFAGIILIVVIVLWAGLGMYQKKLDGQKQLITDQIIKVKGDINSAITQEESDFAVRAHALENDLYRDYDSNDVLGEIEEIMVLKQSDNSGNRVVLKSFQYNAGSNTEKTFKDGNATITGAGSVTITADADTFDVMAQQIDAFKKSSYFNNIKVGTTDRDDFGRIIFTLTMDVNGYERSPYEDSDTVKTGDVEEQRAEAVEYVEDIENAEDTTAVDAPVLQPSETEIIEESTEELIE